MSRRIAFMLAVLTALAAPVWSAGGTEGAAGSQPAASGALPDKPEDLTMPIAKEPITLKYFIGMDFGKIGVHTDNYAKMGGYREMEKRTGIKVEFIHPAAGQDNEKFNLMVASGDLPDIMYRGWTAQAGGPQKMLDDKVIQPLNPLVARYAPNIKAFLDQEPAIKKMVVTDDGILYSFPIVRYKQSILAPYGWQVRGDWMEQVGLTALPETLDEWYTFLKTFKEKDPAGNGKTVPFMLYEIKHGRGPRIFLWAYGMEYGWYQVDGKVKFGPYEPLFKDYLTRMAQWYKEGLIVKDFATIATNTPYDSKVANNEAAGWFGGLGDTMGRFIAAYKKDPNSKFYVRPIAAPTLKKGEKGWNFSFDTITTGQGAAISTKTKYPKEATKWLDYHYSSEGHLMMNFGVEGVSYRMENGKPVLTDEILKNPKGYSIDVALGQYTQGASGEAQILRRGGPPVPDVVDAGSARSVAAVERRPGPQAADAADHPDLGRGLEVHLQDERRVDPHPRGDHKVHHGPEAHQRVRGLCRPAQVDRDRRAGRHAAGSPRPLQQAVARSAETSGGALRSRTGDPALSGGTIAVRTSPAAPSGRVGAHQARPGGQPLRLPHAGAGGRLLPRVPLLAAVRGEDRLQGVLAGPRHPGQPMGRAGQFRRFFPTATSGD